MTLELQFYQTVDRRRPLEEWLGALKDGQAVIRIESRLQRLHKGNFGDSEPVGEGVMELRIDWGPGYRVYFARLGTGGDPPSLWRRQANAAQGHQACEGIFR